jgi:serine/threonine protein kinase/cell division septation protein DedD
MSESSSDRSGSSPPRGLGNSGRRQDTVLLTDVPASAPEENTANRAPASQPNLPSLSSTAFAALSQRYDILAEAGHGSMGNVYKAVDRETGETVALKILKPEIASDQAMMDRFKNELLFARKITHKNVCRVHDFNRYGGIAVTSMEFVEGESLRSVLVRFGGLPQRKAIDAGLQICSGLKEAHAQGIVHRDLKPENIMIDEQGNIKIMDFGIARSMEAATHLTGTMVGTPAYMAPEQAAGKPVDYRTDIYSLGLILYEVFTGTQAFHAETPIAVALKQMRESPRPPHELDPTIPVGVERAILKCLEKEPSRRFQSILELEQALRNSGAAQPIVPGTAARSIPIAPDENAEPPRHLQGDRHSHPHNLAPMRLLSAKLHADSQPRHASPILWILLGAFLVIALGAGLKWAAAANLADRIAPPAGLPAPKPPDFAYEIPPEQTKAPDDAAPTAATDTAAPATNSQSADNSLPAPEAAPVATAPLSNLPAPTASKPHGTPPEPARAKKPPVPTAVLQTAPQDVQKRADKAFKESGAKNSSARDFADTYLWVGRYEREDRAQAAAKKLRDLGLHAMVIPKHGANGDFHVVVTGPYSPSRVSSVTEWLETQGFSNVHPFAIPGSAKKKD